jgi:adenine C2-methylase RlmN of 23S rRNA A2503 and tRNA A37
MSKRRELHPNSIWDVNAVLQAFHEAGIEKCEFHAIRLWGHLIRCPNDSWHDVAGLPEVAKFVLDSEFKKFTARLHAVQRSSDSETLKLLLQLQDGLRIEAVVMRYDTHSTSSASGSALGGVRSTLCVSSQVGCKMGCKFCATGK